MRHNLILNVCGTVLLLLVTSCMEKTDLYNPERINEEIKASFDFRTTVNCPVEITLGREALIRIYADNPEKANDSKQLYVAYTDKNGHYNGKMTLPSEYIGKTVYASAYGINIPATVSTEGLKFNVANNLASTRALTADIDLCTRLKQKFMDRLPENKDNTSQLENVDNINLKVVESDTEVLFSFVYSGASRTAQIYYYYYPTDFNTNQGGNPGSQNYFYNAEKGYGDYERIISRFKNDKFLLTKGYGDNGYINISNNNKTGFSIPVQFYGEDGNATTGSNFPEGYSIGFFIISSWPDVFEPIFTDWWCNSHQDGGIKHHTNQWQHNNKQAVRFKDSESGKIIFGFEDIALNETTEDKCDFDYNDFLFLITTSPDIDKEDIPELNEDITESVEGTLLYEDLYPSEGDYDMNDVIIEYTWTKYFDGSNKLTKIDYEFTPVHDGASYTSNFSLMIDGYVNQPIEIFEDHKASLNQAFRGSITEGIAGKQKDDISWESFNPFITVTGNGREVHLTKKKASANANLDGLDEYQKNYVSGIGEYPFAMNIPRKGFIPVTESQRIETDYPDYKHWAETKGKENTDWYNHHKQ